MIRSSRLWLFIAFISITGLLAVVQEASAEFTLDLEVREAYEDNVIGLVADNPNIISTTLGATAGEVAGGGVGAGGGSRNRYGQTRRTGEAVEVRRCI